MQIEQFRDEQAPTEMTTGVSRRWDQIKDVLKSLQRAFQINNWWVLTNLIALQIARISGEKTRIALKPQKSKYVSIPSGYMSIFSTLETKALVSASLLRK